MNASIYKRLIFGVLILTTIPAFAQDKVNNIQFKGQILDGPFKDQNISGVCKRDPLGDFYKQQTRCVVRLSGGFKVVDANASLEVVGGYRALRVVLGPAVGSEHQKGNFKLSSFQATTFYDRDISLFEFPREFSAVDVSIAGVSVAGGTATTNPDCLIWDIAGDG